MSTDWGGAGAPVSQAVLRVGGITLHETAAYLVILAVIAVVLAFVSNHVSRRRQRENLEALRRLLRRH